MSDIPTDEEIKKIKEDCIKKCRDAYNAEMAFRKLVKKTKKMLLAPIPKQKPTPTLCTF
jgi:hypothetical protein